MLNGNGETKPNVVAGNSPPASAASPPPTAQVTLASRSGDQPRAEAARGFSAAADIA
jgi:hypothetical protein